MGTMLLAGQGVEENREYAAYWFDQAANQGHVDAQYNLGLMFESGDGVPEDKEQAAFWLAKACSGGDQRL
ncbi:unnamed protein product [Polarella glacialis]|uniref:Sel1 repeat family protein n=1 Tax=Polarella glacialis TaxID=89957 RepID=A0A813L4G6_POLGL|nr:unnamed protein product [Polarella glacialis]